MSFTVRVREGPFDPGAETNRFLAGVEDAGAAVTFTGLVRSEAHAPLQTLVLDCYPELAQAQIEALIQSAIERFHLVKAEVIHRFGALQPGDPIVQVMTLAPHRRAAFEAAEFLMDHLKTEAPFWKKEVGATGERWVEAAATDDTARTRWESHT